MNHLDLARKSHEDTKTKHLEAYDVLCNNAWKGIKYRQLAVMQSVKEFGLLERDLLPQKTSTQCDERQPAVKVSKSHVTLKRGSRPMFCKPQKTPLP